MSGTKDAALERLQGVLSRIVEGGRLPQERLLIESQNGAVRAALESVSTGRKEVAQALKPFGWNLVFVDTSSYESSVRMIYSIEPKNPARDHVLNFIFEGSKVVVASRATPERKELDVNEFDIASAIDAFALYVEGMLVVSA